MNELIRRLLEAALNSGMLDQSRRDLVKSFLSQQGAIPQNSTSSTNMPTLPVPPAQAPPPAPIAPPVGGALGGGYSGAYMPPVQPASPVRQGYLAGIPRPPVVPGAYTAPPGAPVNRWPAGVPGAANSAPQRPQPPVAPGPSGVIAGEGGSVIRPWNPRASGATRSASP